MIIYLTFRESSSCKPYTMLKSMEKLKVRIDQNLNRSEKSVALPLDLLQIGE